MDIECKLKREGGTHVDLDKIKYHFAPREDGGHVAAVESEEHQDRFLGIPEAYRVYRGTEKPRATLQASAATTPAPIAQPVAIGAQVGDPFLLGSSVHPASFDIHGKNYSLGDVVALAHKASGLDLTEWNELSEDMRHDLIDEQLDKLNADTNGDAVVDTSEERTALAAEYKAKFGKAPHGKWDAATIRDKLAASA